MTANAGDRWAWAVKFGKSAAGVDGPQQDERWVKLIWVAPTATGPYSRASSPLSRILMNFFRSLMGATTPANALQLPLTTQ